MSLTDTTKLAREGIVALVGKVVGRGLNALLNVLLARLFGPEAFGMYALGWGFMRMLGLISPLGLDKGVIYFGTKHCKADERRFNGVLLTSLGLALVWGVLLSLVTFLFAPWLADTIFRKPETVSIFRLFGIVFGAYAVLRVASAATTIPKRIHYSVLSQELVQPIVALVLVLLSYGSGLDIAAAIGGVVFSFGVAAILAVYFLRDLFPNLFSLQSKAIFDFKSLLSFSIPSAFAGMFSMYMIWTNQLIVGRYCTLLESGIYQAVSQIALLLPIIQASFTPAIMPLITDLWDNGDKEKLEELYRVATKWTLYLIMPVSLVILLSPQGLISLLFGASYAPGASALRLLTLAQLVNIATGAVGPLLVMTGHQRRWSLISGGAYLVSFIAGLLFVPRMNVFGAALSITLSFVIMYVWGLIEIRRQIGIWPYDSRYMKGSLAFVLSGLVMRGIKEWVTLSSNNELFLMIFVALSMFGGILLVLGVDEEDLSLLKTLWGRLSPLFHYPRNPS